MTGIQKGLCIAASAGLLLAFGAFTQRERIREHISSKQCIAAAQNYLQQKYGFNGTVQNTYNVFSYWNVLFKDQEHEYYVYLDADRQPIQDTYQYDEITAAVKKQITDACPGCLKIDLSLSGPERYLEDLGDNVRFCFGLNANTKYDGSNLDQILTDCKADLTAVFAETDLADFSLTGQLEAWNADGRMFSFDSKEHAEAFLHSSRDLQASPGKNAELFAPHITQIRTFDSTAHNSEVTGFALQEGDGFLFFSPKVPGVTCIGPEPLPQQGVTGTYQFNSGTAQIYVYYPAASLQNADNLCAVYAAAGESSTREISPEHCGDYLVFSISGEPNPRWTLRQKQQ